MVKSKYLLEVKLPQHEFLGKNKMESIGKVYYICGEGDLKERIAKLKRDLKEQGWEVKTSSFQPSAFYLSIYGKGDDSFIVPIGDINMIGKTHQNLLSIWNCKKLEEFISKYEF